MSNEQDSKGGEGRGLPRGWEWREGTGSLPPVVSSYLYAPGADDYNAGAYNDGAWIAYSGESRAEMVDEYDPAPGGPYSPALLAAAQTAAEAALWACDGYGTGEVRGRFVAHGQGFGLPGRWRLKGARAVPGGHEVDAVREGVEVDAARAPSAGDLCPACGTALPSTGIGCGSCRWVGEPLPGDAVRAPVPVDKAARAWASISQIGDDGSHPADAGHAPAEPAPSREPSAPADGGELARLLPGLPAQIRFLLTGRATDIEIAETAERDCARACELLLAERAKTERRIAILTQTADAGEIAVGALERQRARAEEAERKLYDVAALQRTTATDLDAARAQLRIVQAGREDVWHWQGDGRDDPASLVCPVVMSQQTLRAMTATPPPGTVAALLARAEEAASASGASAAKIEAEDGEDAADYQSGHAHGMGEAASLIRATLGAPSPLETVVAEVCALPVEMPTFYASVDSVEDGLHAVDMLIGDHELPRRDRLARIARVALAGMLACDAAKGGDT